MERCQIAFPTGARAEECQINSTPVLFYFPPRQIGYDIHIYKVKMNAWSQHFWGLLTEPPLAQMARCWIYSVVAMSPLSPL